MLREVPKQEKRKEKEKEKLLVDARNSRHACVQRVSVCVSECGKRWWFRRTPHFRLENELLPWSAGASLPGGHEPLGVGLTQHKEALLIPVYTKI